MTQKTSPKRLKAGLLQSIHPKEIADESFLRCNVKIDKVFKLRNTSILAVAWGKYNDDILTSLSAAVLRNAN